MVTRPAPSVKPIPAFTHWPNDGIASSTRDGVVPMPRDAVSWPNKSSLLSMCSTVAPARAVVNG